MPTGGKHSQILLIVEANRTDSGTSNFIGWPPSTMYCRIWQRAAAVCENGLPVCCWGAASFTC